MAAPLIDLVASEDADFVWMLVGGPGRLGLVLPPGGVDDEENLHVVRGMNAVIAGAHDRGAWMIVRNGEVVGLCGYVHPPIAGEVEIGFGVASSRRNRGYGSAAVAAVLKAASDDALVTVVVARTATGNLASQRILKRNGFVQAGTEYDESDGEMLVWRRAVE